MKKNIPVLLLSSTLGFSAYAQQLPNAGTITRQAEQQTVSKPETQIINPTNTNVQVDLDDDSTPIKVSNIHLKGRTLVTQLQLQPLLDEYIGQTTTFGGLQKLSQSISQFYEQAGYPLVTVVIPPQRINNGEIVLQVIEGKINKINIQNQSRIPDPIIQKYIGNEVLLNQPFKQAGSERALLLVKDLAGTDQVSYQIGKDTDGTILDIDLNGVPLWNGYVNIDNYGSKSTGEWRTRAGVNLNSPFGRGERISLQAMSSFQGVDYARLSSDIPLGYQGLNLTVGAAHTKYDLGGDFKNLEATGSANSIDVGFRYPLVRSNQRNLWLTTNGEYRDLQDEVGATKTITDKSLKAIRIGLNGYHQNSTYAGGYTQWSLNNTVGNLDIDSRDAQAIDAASAKTQGAYHKLNASLAYTQYLTPRLSVFSSLQGQWANKNLDSVEQISLGGVDSVAAYHSNDVSADLGLIGQMEVRYALHPKVSVSAFYDAGRAKLREKPYTKNDNFVNLHGGGIGIYAQHEGLSLQSKIAWQGSDEKFNNDKNPRWWLKAGYNF